AGRERKLRQRSIDDRSQARVLLGVEDEALLVKQKSIDPAGLERGLTGNATPEKDDLHRSRMSLRRGVEGRRQPRFAADDTKVARGVDERGELIDRDDPDYGDTYDEGREYEKGARRNALVGFATRDQPDCSEVLHSVTASWKRSDTVGGS